MTSNIDSHHASVSNSDIVFKVSAPGKVILHGEHSVVHGKLALAGSIDLRTSLTFKENTTVDGSSAIELQFSDINLQYQLLLKDIQALLDKTIPTISGIASYSFRQPKQIDHDIHLKNIEEFVSQNEHSPNLTQGQKNALTTFLYMFVALFAPFNIKLTPSLVSVSSQLSLGAGTGSSASFVVCIVASLIHYLKLKLSENSKDILKSGYAPIALDAETGSTSFSEKDLQLISDWSFRGEKIFHGNPSGIDNVICTYGSMVAFRTIMVPYQFKINVQLKVMLINTMVSRDTKTLVAKVQELQVTSPCSFKFAIESMEKIAMMALQNFEQLNNPNSSIDSVKKLFNILGGFFEVNHLLLDFLGVSHPALEDIVSILRRFGLKGKLTGAGGGGYAIALVPPDFEEQKIHEVLTNLKDNGYDARIILLGANGVRVDDH